MGIRRSLLLLVAMALCWSSSTASNVLFTGQTLSNQSIGLPGVGAFIMQLDCNLVLYDAKGVAWFHTNTAGIGSRNCILSFTNNGRLVVRNPAGNQMWISPNSNSRIGEYAAVFRPDGDVAIYGPIVWSSIIRIENLETVQEQRQQQEATGAEQELLGNMPMVENMLFSGQVLYGKGSLKDQNNSLEVTSDCKLVLKTSSGLSIVLGSLAGNDCFIRLNFRGILTLLDDTYGLMWTSRPWTVIPPRGEYVLILRGGVALIYGPVVWSTNVRNVPNAQPIVNLMLASDAQE